MCRGLHPNQSCLMKRRSVRRVRQYEMDSKRWNEQTTNEREKKELCKDKHTHANTNVCLNYKCTFFVLLPMHVQYMEMDMVQYGYSCSFSAYPIPYVRARKLHFQLHSGLSGCVRNVHISIFRECCFVVVFIVFLCN